MSAPILWGVEESFWGAARQNRRWQLGDMWVFSLLGGKSKANKQDGYGRLTLSEIWEQITTHPYRFFFRTVFINSLVIGELGIRQLFGRPLMTTRWSTTVPGSTKSRSEVRTGDEVEAFDVSVQDKIKEIKRDVPSADMVVLVPFYNEIAKDTNDPKLPGTHGQTIDVRNLVRTIHDSLPEILRKHGLNRALILCVGETKGKTALDTLAAVEALQGEFAKEDDPVRIAVYGKNERFAGLAGKKWALRMGMKVATELGAHFVTIDGDMEIDSQWLSRLVGPVLSGKSEYVSPNYTRYYRKDDIAMIDHIVFPLFAAFFGKAVRLPNAGEFASSKELTGEFLKVPDIWEAKNPFEEHFALQAVLLNKVSENVWVGEKRHKTNPLADQLDNYLGISFGALFDQIANHPDWWESSAGSAVIDKLSGTGLPAGEKFPPASEVYSDLLTKTEAGVLTGAQAFKKVYGERRKSFLVNLPEAMPVLDEQASREDSEVGLSSKEWAKIVMSAIRKYLEAPGEQKKAELIKCLAPVFMARILGFLSEIAKNKGATMSGVEALLIDQAQDFADEKVRVFGSRARSEVRDDAAMSEAAAEALLKETVDPQYYHLIGPKHIRCVIESKGNIRVVVDPKAEKPSESLKVYGMAFNPLKGLKDPAILNVFRQIIERRYDVTVLEKKYGLGKAPEVLTFEGRKITAKQFASEMTRFLLDHAAENPYDVADAFRNQFLKDGPPEELKKIFSDYMAIKPEVFDLDVIRDLIPAQGVVADIGAGHNVLGQQILGYADTHGLNVRHVVGTDINDWRDAGAKQDSRLEFVYQDSTTEFPLSANSYDTVIVKWVLHHMSVRDQSRFLDDIERILKPGGRLVVFEALGVPSEDAEVWNGYHKELGQENSWGPQGDWREANLKLNRDFRKLSIDQQKRLNALEDYFGHNVVMNRVWMPQPFTYRTVEESRSVLEHLGFAENKSLRRVYGSSPQIRVGPPSVRLVYEKQKTPITLVRGDGGHNKAMVLIEGVGPQERQHLKNILNVLVYQDKVRRELARERVDDIVLLGNERIDTFEEALQLLNAGIGRRVVILGGYGAATVPLIHSAVKLGYEIEIAPGTVANRKSWPPILRAIKADRTNNFVRVTEAEIIRQIMGQMVRGWPNHYPHLAARVESEGLNRLFVTEGQSMNTRRLLVNYRSRLDREGAFDRVGGHRIIFMQKPSSQLRAKAAFDELFAVEMRAHKISTVSHTVSYDNVPGDEVGTFRELLLEIWKIILYSDYGKGDINLRGVYPDGINGIPQGFWKSASFLFDAMSERRKTLLAIQLMALLAQEGLTSQEISPDDNPALKTFVEKVAQAVQPSKEETSARSEVRGQAPSQKPAPLQPRVWWDKKAKAYKTTRATYGSLWKGIRSVLRHQIASELDMWQAGGVKGGDRSLGIARNLRRGLLRDMVSLGRSRNREISGTLRWLETLVRKGELEAFRTQALGLYRSGITQEPDLEAMRRPLLIATQMVRRFLDKKKPSGKKTADTAAAGMPAVGQALLFEVVAQAPVTGVPQTKEELVARALDQLSKAESGLAVSDKVLSFSNIYAVRYVRERSLGKDHAAGERDAFYGTFRELQPVFMTSPIAATTEGPARLDLWWQTLRQLLIEEKEGDLFTRASVPSGIPQQFLSAPATPAARSEVRDDAEELSPRERLWNKRKGDIRKSLNALDSYVTTINRLNKELESEGKGPGLLSRWLFEVSRDSEVFRGRVSDYYEALRELSKQGEEGSEWDVAFKVIENMGVGHIVAITPEIYPWSIGGGMAQVLDGLPRALAKNGAELTVITFLYNESQGKKHKSAADLLRDGVEIDGKIVPLEDTGKRIAVPFGPTVHTVGHYDVTRAHTEMVDVYRARNGGVTVYFLNHPWLTNRLYPSVASSEQLKRSILLSRGSLEVMREFDLYPDNMLANDWMAAPTFGILKGDTYYGITDYRRDEHFYDAQTGFVPKLGYDIHNLGRDYQARFYAVENQVDLWPLFLLQGQHYMGFSNREGEDWNHPKRFNLVRGGIVHSNFVLTVSPSYAREILTWQKGNGLHEDFYDKGKIYGISNGVNVKSLRSEYTLLGGGTDPTRQPVGPFVQELQGYKSLARHEVQSWNKLKVMDDAIFMSFVGRISNQKGVGLIAEQAKNFLDMDDRIQLLIAGPIAEGDDEAYWLMDAIRWLESNQKYAGRVRGIFEMVAFRETLRILLASKLFLMPSKYEPGGLTQLESLGGGTGVVAHEVGGIADTLKEFDAHRGIGDAFFFNEFTGQAFLGAAARGVQAVRSSSQGKMIMVQAATAPHDWGDKVPAYVSMFQNEAGVYNYDYPHLREKVKELDKIIAYPDGGKHSEKRSEVREVRGGGNVQSLPAVVVSPAAKPAVSSAATDKGVSRSELRAGRMVQAMRKNAQPAAVFLDAEDFPGLSPAQKKEFLIVALSSKALQIVVYNERGQVQDEEFQALLKLDRVTRTDRDLSQTLQSYSRPGVPAIHLSKNVLPSQTLVQGYRKKVAFFRESGQKSGTLATALLWAVSGGEAIHVAGVSQEDGFWTVADALLDSLQRSFESDLAISVAA